MRYTSFRIAVRVMLAASLVIYAASARAKEKEERPESSPLAVASFLANRLDPEGVNRRDDTLRQIARINWRLGRQDETLRVLRSMRCDERAYESAHLAGEAAKASQNKFALKLIEQSMACAREEDFHQKGSVLNNFIKTLIKLRKYDLALSVTEAIEGETSSRAFAFVALADSYIVDGRNSQAMEMLARAFAEAQTADDEYMHDKCEALVNIAEGYSRIGDSSQAAAVLSFAARLAEQEGDMNRDEVKSVVAVGYAQAGQVEQAMRLSESLRDIIKTGTLIRIASVHIEKGRKTEALFLLSKSVPLAESAGDESYDKDVDLAEIVRVYLQADEPRLAAEVVQRIKRGYYLTKATLQVADWAFEHKRNDLATEILDSAFQKLRAIASEKPEEIQPMMSSSRAREKATYLSQIADKYVTAGLFDKAQQAAFAIDLPQWKAGKMADVAGAAARVWPRARIKELLGQALRLSDASSEYPHDMERDWALAKIAGRFAEVGGSEQASKLFARLLEMARGLADYDDRLYRLAEIGFYFEKAGMKPDTSVKNALSKIVKEWTED